MLFFEDAERVRIGHHQRGDIVGRRLLQRAEIDHARSRWT